MRSICIYGLLFLSSFNLSAQTEDSITEVATDYYKAIFAEFSYILEITDTFMAKYEWVHDDPQMVLEEQAFWQDQILLSIQKVEEMPDTDDFVMLKDAILAVLLKMQKLSVAYKKGILLIAKSKKRDANWDKLMYEMSIVNNELYRYSSELDPLLNKAGKVKKGFRKKFKVKEDK